MDTFNKILVPIDLSEAALGARALQRAVIEVQQHEAQMHVMTVVPGFSMPMVAAYFPANAMKKAKEEVREQLKQLVAKNVPAEITTYLSVAEGSPHRQIVKQAEKLSADLIIIPSKGSRSMDNLALGSCASKVVETSPCSVMVLR